MLLSLGGHAHGHIKTHLQHIATADAVNVGRLQNWLTATPRAKTRFSRFARLDPAALTRR